MILIRFYRLWCRKTGRWYVGKTRLILDAEVPSEHRKSRLYYHEKQFKRWKRGKGNRRGSFAVLEGGDYKIDLIKAFEFDTDNENDIIIRIHEQMFIDAEKEDCGDLCCNINNAYTSKEEVARQVLENSCRWRKENPEYSCQWRKENPEYGQKANIKWRLANPEYGRNASKEWRLANPEKVRAHNAKHSADRKLKRQAVRELKNHCSEVLFKN